jgi:hypothetical protein
VTEERDIDAEIDDDVQREIDERALADAYLEGQRAGLQGIAAGLNPWADEYSAEFKRWEAGRAAGESMRLNQNRKVA